MGEIARGDKTNDQVSLLVGMLSDRLHMGAAGLMVAISAISVPAYCLGAITLVATSGAYREALRQLSAETPA